MGVGPGSPEYLTEKVKKIIQDCEIVIGYKYTLKTIEDLLKDKQIYEVTMKDQEDTYQMVKQTIGKQTVVIPFTGDVNFSESEVVDRLIEIYGNVEIIPGISSIQVAAAKAKIPLDKSRVITLHVSISIEEKKLELQKALIDGYSVILVPRPWPNDPKKHFMPSEIAHYLKSKGFETSKMKVHVFEALTTDRESEFEGVVEELEGNEFSDLSVMVFNQNILDSYRNID